MTFGQLFKSITRAEWLFVALLSAVLIVITTAPAIYGYIVTPAEHVFTAMHFVSADDWFVYYSFINQGKEGALLFKDLFAPVDHVPNLRVLWLPVGWLAALFNLSAPAAFHLARILLIPPFVAISYLFLSYFFKDTAWRKFTALMLFFSSGLGILFVYRLVLYPTNFFLTHFRWPMDLWVPDINTFLTIFTSPHFIAASILLFLILLLTLLFVDHKNYWYATWSGLAALVLFMFHPFQVVKLLPIIGVFFLYLMFRDKKFSWPFVWYGLIFGALSSPAIFYYLWLMQVDWLTVQRAAQNINPSTPPYLTVVAFFGFFIFGAIALYRFAKEKTNWNTPQLFLITWVLAQLLMLYAPIVYQRRTGLGFHFPLVMLTIFGMQYVYARHQEWIKKNIGAVLLCGSLLFLPSTLFALSVDVMVYNQARELSYISIDEYNAYQWLRENSAEDSITFAALKTSNVLPAYAVRTSYVGHAVETPLYIDKKLEPEWFFGGNRDEEIEVEFLKERNIDFVLHGPREKELGSYNPAIKDYLEVVYESPAVSLYKVR